MNEDVTDNTEHDWDDSPEGITAWLDWYRSLEPLDLTDTDRAIIEEARRSSREWELAHADERAEKLRKLWDALAG
jgi:hypothetical protein